MPAILCLWIIGSSVFSTVNDSSFGEGGDINIITGSLSLTRGSQLVSSTFGQGDAGSININARNTVSLDGEGPLKTPLSSHK
jgi:large exoprotein involved in heme utilization and adhesion